MAVEKIGGIPGIERKRLEAGKWLKHSGSPLPAVTQHLPGSIRVNGDGVPVLEIVIAGAIGRLARSTIKLRLGGQRLACPRGVSRGLLLRDVDWPGDRQGRLAEHGSLD